MTQIKIFQLIEANIEMGNGGKTEEIILVW